MEHDSAAVPSTDTSTSSLEIAAPSTDISSSSLEIAAPSDASTSSLEHDSAAPSTDDSTSLLEHDSATPSTDVSTSLEIAAQSTDVSTSSLEHDSAAPSTDASTSSLEIAVAPAPQSLKRKRDDDPEKQTKLLEEGEEVDWVCRFSQGQSVKDFMESIASVTTEGFFEVVMSDDFSGVVTDSIDAEKAALVQGRLSATVQMSGTESSNFVVRMRDVTTCLRNAHAQHFLKIWRPRGSSDIVMHVYEPDVNTFMPTFRIKTLDIPSNSLSLQSTTYSLLVEIELHALRDAVKTAKDHKADTMEMKVFTPKIRQSQRLSTFFVLACESDTVASVFPFQSVTETESLDEEGEPLTVKVSECTNGDYAMLPSSSDLKELFSSRFSTDYLLKSRPRKVSRVDCNSCFVSV
jgi:hypothetical protein